MDKHNTSLIWRRACFPVRWKEKTKVHLVASLLGLCMSLLWTSVSYGQQLYGSSSRNGSDFLGTIVAYDIDQSRLDQVHTFTYETAGRNPQYNQMTLFNGKLYGMMTNGQISSGVIFEYDPTTNTYEDKVFLNDSTGTFPYGSLTLKDGKFYGMTSQGGANNAGVIFEWDPSNNVFEKKYDFNNTDGKNPFGSLTLVAGKFYGMTRQGGTNNVGVIFEWNPTTNTYLKRQDLSNTNGSLPNGDLTYADGFFYGMTSAGGINSQGTIFQWNPSSNVYIKKQDLSFTNGSQPTGSLTQRGGKFYGMTRVGGDQGDGVIFEWDSLSNVYLKRYSFSESNKQGHNPYGNLTLKDGKFYGLTSEGGEQDEFNNQRTTQGVLFEWDPDSLIYEVLYEFNGLDNQGMNPRGTLTFVDSTFYGLTHLTFNAEFVFGGRDSGTIFEFDPNNFNYRTRIEFGVFDGVRPSALTFYNGKFYGTTDEGKLSDVGVVFEVDPSTNTFTALRGFEFNTSSTPGELSEYDGDFYGVTSNGVGPAFGVGGIFKWNSTLNRITEEFDFENLSFENPGVIGPLVLRGDKFYGVTSQQGNNGSGYIFEYDPTTRNFVEKISFGGINGSQPSGPLVLRNNKFYGTTASGGANSVGFIYEWDPDTNAFINKYDFDGTTAKGSAQLVLKGDVFFGTAGGGTNDRGVIFEWNPDTGAFTKHFDFSTAQPRGNLTVVGDVFYGTSTIGGTNNRGVLFKWDTLSNTYTVLENYDQNSGSPGKLVVLPTTWEGPSTANWNSASNWGGEVPGAGDNVVIPEGVQVIIDSPVSVGSIELSEGSSIVIADGGSINLLNNYSGAGELILSGTTPKTLPSGFTTVEKLTINNDADVTLSEDLIVNDAINLQKGDLNLNGQTLDLGATGSLTEDLDNGYIVKDLTAVDADTPGGSIIATNRTVGSTNDDIAGLGIELQKTAGSDYTVDVVRFHYPGANNGISKVVWRHRECQWYKLNPVDQLYHRRTQWTCP